jgi:hypothetical protein
MDRVHGFSSWVHNIVDQSRPLILIRTGRILLKRKGWTAHIKLGRWRRCTGPEWWRQRGLARAPLLSSPRHGDAGFLGQNDVRVDMVLTWGETWWGTAPRWLVAAATLLWARATVSGGSGALPTSRSSSASSSWPPLASRLVQWLQSMMVSSNLVAARVWQVSRFAS